MNKGIAIFDIEADDLLEDATKIHCLSAIIKTDSGEEKISYTAYDEIKQFLKEDYVLVGHNIICYDLPLIEKLLNVEIDYLKHIDTLALSWYLFPNRKVHGLQAWGEELGVKKPEIEDWKGLDTEEYVHRCEEDVKITYKLFSREFNYLNRLYEGEKYNSLIKYLTFKMWCAKLQQDSKWKLNIKRCDSELRKLEQKIEKATRELETNIPRVKKYRDKPKPKIMYKKDGSLSSYGEEWLEMLKERGLPEDHEEDIKVVRKIEKPNAASHVQIKNWLFSLGWEPCTFKEGANGDVPQVRDPNTGDLTQSVVKLMEKEPSIKLLEGLGVLQHRQGLLAGFLKNADSDGFLTARVAGLTNTLRFKHAELVNLPGVDKFMGEVIRGCLISRDSEHELVGSDVSSLEDTTKQNYMIPYDREYVMEMRIEDYDPHIDIAVLSGLITEREAEYHKYYKNKFGDEEKRETEPTERQTEVYNRIHEQRKKAKITNFSSLYGIGAEKLSRTLDISLGEAEKLKETYWDRNWSVKEIAENCETKEVNGQMWLHNTISKLWYSLREDKDRFSTLNQGTGAYCFDMWLFFVLKRRPQLTGQFHDELIIEVKRGYREGVKNLLQWAMNKANEKLKLDIPLSIDTQFGNNYSEVH